MIFCIDKRITLSYIGFMKGNFMNRDTKYEIIINYDPSRGTWEASIKGKLFREWKTRMQALAYLEGLSDAIEMVDGIEDYEGGDYDLV